MQQETLGPKHPNALDGKLLLAECCLDLGRIKEASAAARFSFRVRRRNFGPRHPRTLSAAVILAAACAKRRRTRQAKQLLRGALCVLFKEQGHLHPLTLSTVSDLLALHRGPSTQSTLWRVWQAQRQLLGPHHPDVRCTALRMARMAARDPCRKRRSENAHQFTEREKRRKKSAGEI
eukprot:symbB.v1.2.041455.t1/scaffold8227.1/size7198/1